MRKIWGGTGKLHVFMFYQKGKQTTMNFSFSFWSWIVFSGIGRQENSSTFEKVSELGIIALKKTSLFKWRLRHRPRPDIQGTYATTTATATKTSLKRWSCAASNFFALKPSRLARQMLVNCLELSSIGLYQSSGKEKRKFFSCDLGLEKERHHIASFDVGDDESLASKK